MRFETFAPSIIKTEQVFRKLDSSYKKERKRLEISILRDNQRNFATKKIIDMIQDQKKATPTYKYSELREKAQQLVSGPLKEEKEKKPKGAEVFDLIFYNK